MAGVPVGKRRWTAFVVGMTAWLTVEIIAQFKGGIGVDTGASAAFIALCGAYFGSKFAEK